jgi:hypothetical protein
MTIEFILLSALNPADSLNPNSNYSFNDALTCIYPFLGIFIIVILVSFIPFLEKFIRNEFVVKFKENWKYDILLPLHVYVLYYFLKHVFNDFVSLVFFWFSFLVVMLFFNLIFKKGKGSLLYFNDIFSFFVLIGFNIYIFDKLDWSKIIHHAEELGLILSSFYCIMFFKVARAHKNNLKKLSEKTSQHWIDYVDKLNNTKKSIFGLNTTDFNEFFIPDGIRYFIHQMDTFGKGKPSDDKEVKRVIVINSDNNEIDAEIFDTWVNSAINNLSQLPEEYKKFKNLIQLHMVNDFDLYIITEGFLLETLVEILYKIEDKILIKNYIQENRNDLIKIKNKIDIIMFDDDTCFHTSEDLKKNLFLFEEVTDFTLNENYTYLKLIVELKLKFCIEKNDIKSILKKFNLTSVY